MEVDEAANHIKELVDPDANIIWGSAFNNDLEGKIRVSVVATGIEADAATMPEPAKLFAFPPRTRSDEKPVIAPTPAPAPVAEVAPTPVVESQPAATDELDLTEEEIVLEAPAPVAVAAPKVFGEDELLLDTDTILTPPVTSNPLPPSEPPAGPRSWVAEPEPAPRAPRPAREGGTLFERMSNIARGAAKAQVEEEAEPGRARDPLDIPRFLNRQNNQ
jgi:cell division protein FtsZ